MIRSWTAIGTALLLLPWAHLPAQAGVLPGSLRLVVNSNQDGEISPDDKLTLREAIAVANGTLSRDRLSPPEQRQVTTLPSSQTRIEFNLPAGQTTIQLIALLPPLEQPGLILDGTSQPGYGATPGQGLPGLVTPVIALTPAPQAEVFRGLTITADRVTIRGLSLYGFTAQHRSTALTPPADILIAHRLPPPDTTQQQAPAKFAPFYPGNLPPQGVVIEQNWLGTAPDGQMPRQRSAFGVSVFNAVDTRIQSNWIAYHDGSAVITSVQARKLQIRDNLILHNGLAGMPDALRLEGEIEGTQIVSNQICGNAGSGVFLFKPEGQVVIQGNQIRQNGRQLRRAAIYLMGNQHQVLHNEITDQPGAGVVVAAYPSSQGNLILENRFLNLDGLSIDLVTQGNTGVQDYQTGDGPNPRRNSPNRRLDTGNGAVNAPEFASPDFYQIGDRVTIEGSADPNTQVELYRVQPGTDTPSQFLFSVPTDATGRFAVSLDSLQPGDRISATATDFEYGTSEASAIALIRSLTATADPLPQLAEPQTCPGLTLAPRESARR